MKEETFGRRLSKTMDDKNIQGKDLAKKVGVNPASITLYKQDKRNPNDEILARIAEVLEVDFNWLKDGTKLVRMSGKDALNVKKHLLTDDELFSLEEMKDQLDMEEFKNKFNSLLISERALINNFFVVYTKITDSEWFLLNIYNQVNAVGKKKIEDFINSMSISAKDVVSNLSKITAYQNVITTIKDEYWYQKTLITSSEDDITLFNNKEKKALIELSDSMMRKYALAEGIEQIRINERMDSYISMEERDWRILISYNLLASENMKLDSDLGIKLSINQLRLMDFIEDLILIDKYKKI